MAESLFEDFLSCPVCLETFKEPVSLGCNHSFCSQCLKRHWQQNDCRTCPVCRRRSSKEVIVLNFALNELAISFKAKAKEGEEEVECSRHPEDIRLFCLEDWRTLCPVCEFSRHSRHTVLEAEKAVSEIRRGLRKRAKTLKGKKEMVEKVWQSYEVLQKHSAKQVERCERQIRAEFSKIYQFLKKEEEAKMKELREEQRRQAEAMSLEMEMVQKQLHSLNRSISSMEEQVSYLEQCFNVEKGKGMDFLKEFSQTHSKFQMQESESVPLKIGKELLINEAKILGNLGFKVWEKMRSFVSYSPVILDPNTMSAKLCLSDDLTRVRYAEGRREELPENPERFTNDEIVLGAEGFGEGATPSWTVDVGDYPRWDIGVVRESVDRRGEIFSDAEFGIWCLWHGDGTYNDGDSERVVEVQRRPEKIKVTLDYDEGLLSFHDADDMTPLCSHRHNFTERLFPYVSIGPTAGGNAKGINICNET